MNRLSPLRNSISQRKTPKHFAVAFILTMSCVSTVLMGCPASDKGAPPDEKPGQTAANAAANIDKRIEAIKSDPKIPEAAKQAAIAGMERGKAAQAAASAQSRPPAGAPAGVKKP